MPPRDSDIFGDDKPQAKGDADIFVDVPAEEPSPPVQHAASPTPSYADNLQAGALNVLGGLVRGGPMAAVTAGAGEAMRNIDEVTDKAANAAGGSVTDAAAQVVSPENAARLGFAANVGVRAAPMILSGQWAKSAAAPSFRAMGRGTMQSALKPSYEQLRTGKAAEAIETMLKDGITVSEGGLNKLLSQVNKLDDDVTKAISTSTATVNKGDVGLRLKEVFDKFKMQVNPQSDMEAIKKAWMAFRDHPLLAGKTEIPVQLAQQMKQGTYRVLGDKPYGELQGAALEAQKGLGRGLRETISDAVPAVAPLNAKLGEKLNAANVLERRVLMAPNNNLLGLTPLGPNPLSWALFMADRMPGLKSLLARGLYSGAEQIPATATRVGIGYAMMPPEGERGALYDLWQ